MKIISEIVQGMTPEEKIKKSLDAVKMVFSLVENNAVNENGKYTEIIKLFDEFLEDNKSAEEFEVDPEDMSNSFIYFTSFDMFVREQDDLPTKQANTVLFALKTAYELCMAVYMHQELFLLEDDSKLNKNEIEEKLESPSLEVIIYFAAIAESMPVSSMEDVERIACRELTENEGKVIQAFVNKWKTFKS